MKGTLKIVGSGTSWAWQINTDKVLVLTSSGPNFRSKGAAAISAKYWARKYGISL